MSAYKALNAKLWAYGEPIFLENLYPLMHKAYSNEENRLEKIIEIAKRSKGFQGNIPTETTDGYEWFAGLYFTLKGGKIAVLFPWSLDTSQRHGLKSDRSIAVYKRDSVDDKDIDSLISSWISTAEAESWLYVYDDLPEYKE